MLCFAIFTPHLQTDAAGLRCTVGTVDLAVALALAAAKDTGICHSIVNLTAVTNIGAVKTEDFRTECTAHLAIITGRFLAVRTSRCSLLLFTLVTQLHFED